ncbi:MAG: histidine kinase dimerization/phospho-acceptor domain-containing protein, partial [Armatimonadota bacterium]
MLNDDQSYPALAAALSRSVDEAVLVINSAGRIQSVNNPAAQMFSRTGTASTSSPVAMIGQTVLEATHLRALAELCRRARETGQAGDEDVKLAGWGAERTVRARAVPIQDNVSGITEATLLVLADQTELARLRMVRTEFVANISHELRTPLASIRAMAETLQGGALGDPDAGPRFLE